MKRVLLYNSGGGIGDSIQLFTLILSLQGHLKSTEFFYLGAHDNHFEGKLKEFGIKIKTLNIKLKYFGFRWWHLLFVNQEFSKQKIEKIDLIIDLQSKLRNTIILRKIPHTHFYSRTFNYKFCTKKLDYYSDNHLENLSNILNTNIKILNFKIKDLDKSFINEAKRLLPDKNYVGFSLTQGNIYRKKSWSINNFINLASKIEEKNKTPVFFVEKKDIELAKRIRSHLPNALIPEHHSSMNCPALVTALASRLDLAVTIDNGIMHMLSLANIPMIVLFGPTNSEKFAPKINLINILDSKKLYNSKDINRITVHDVYKLI